MSTREVAGELEEAKNTVANRCQNSGCPLIFRSLTIIVYFFFDNNYSLVYQSAPQGEGGQ